MQPQTGWIGPAGRSPVVVLESTVIAHGLPWPDNLETAIAMEEAVRDAGAWPCTIAVLDGTVRIGLARAELERIARESQVRKEGETSTRVGSPSGWVKANRRDLAAVVRTGGNAATTVSASLWLARRFGLRPCILATGGVGGVHRGASESFDVSTDLDELARADGCLVVCSGFKSILDLSATLEVLESRGVAIAGYRTSELPGFTTRGSGLPLEHRVDSVAEAAELVRAHRDLGLPGAVVVVNPVPVEDAVAPEIAESALADALAEARRRGITGKAVTPFLLEAIREATSGASLRANRSLLRANARLAGEIAVAMAGNASSTTSSSP